jgi:3'-phosphoadenosine 5'-phosphosulfate sulfotransferase (PAPS reductase)/FAD synthetase
MMQWAVSSEDENLVDRTSGLMWLTYQSMKPDYVVSMVSGGKDSAASHAVAVELGIKIDLVIHGNTRCGIPQTSQFVEATYGNGPWDFAVADAGTAYEDYVLRKGFFGKGRDAHNYAYRVLKATPFRKVISAKLRQRKRGIKIMLINGARKGESANRQKTLQRTRSDPAAPGNVWVSAIYDWSQDERDMYLAARSIPINPVATQLCRSGECMCGTTQTHAERAEAAALYPEWGARLDSLEAEVRAKHGFGWGEAFPRKADPRQAGLFQPMCTDCITRAALAPTPGETE